LNSLKSLSIDSERFTGEYLHILTSLKYLSVNLSHLFDGRHLAHLPKGLEEIELNDFTSTGIALENMGLSITPEDILLIDVPNLKRLRLSFLEYENNDELKTYLKTKWPNMELSFR
jgi:hypothetical protein